jgi:DNA-binding response OmpR family regulator
VLILEDDLDTLRSLGEIFAMEGVSVVQGAETIAEAERILADGFLPSAVVLDLRLRGDAGEDFAKRLQGDPLYSAVPIIALSGDPSAVRSISSTVTLAFLKPASPEQLLAALREVCGRRGDTDPKRGS